MCSAVYPDKYQGTSKVYAKHIKLFATYTHYTTEIVRNLSSNYTVSVIIPYRTSWKVHVNNVCRLEAEQSMDL
jgi:hypothetical protein